jgi:hypothetical protein
VGLVHEPSGPPEDGQVAHALPVLGDRGVADAIGLSSAYSELRRAVVALCGVALVQGLGRADPAALAGVVVTAREAAARSRGHLARPLSSRHEPLRRRARRLDAARTQLDDALSALVRDDRSVVPRALLHELRRTLEATALVGAGMRVSGSTGCAAYYRVHDGLGQHHAHHDDHHHHDQGPHDRAALVGHSLEETQ